MLLEFKRAAEYIWIGANMPGTMKDADKIGAFMLGSAGTGFSLFSLMHQQPTSFLLSCLLLAGPLAEYHAAGREAVSKFKRNGPAASPP